MAAEERAGVTVHQAEWGDTRGEAPPPSGPSTPIKADDALPAFRSTPFRYGADLRYRLGIRNSINIQYRPKTRLRSYFPMLRSAYRPGIQYRGAGKSMRGTYQPNIRYAPARSYRSSIRYGLSKR